MPVKRAVIVGFKGGPGGEFAGQHPACQRHARQDADLAPHGFGKEQLGRSLAEDVENDLHGLDVGILNRLEELLPLFQR